jgi:putative redox protein
LPNPDTIRVRNVGMAHAARDLRTPRSGGTLVAAIRMKENAMTAPYLASVISTGTNYLHRIHVGGFDMNTDEGPRLGGQGQGPAPYDYYLASLAACTAITLRMYAERKGWNLGEFRAELSFRRDDAGRVHIHRVLHSDQPLEDAQWQRLLEIADRTPVTKTMREGAVITSARGAGAQ